jgi:hypothetical protein
VPPTPLPGLVLEGTAASLSIHSSSTSRSINDDTAGGDSPIADVVLSGFSIGSSGSAVSESDAATGSNVQERELLPYEPASCSSSSNSSSNSSTASSERSAAALVSAAVVAVRQCAAALVHSTGAVVRAAVPARSASSNSSANSSLSSGSSSSKGSKPCTGAGAPAVRLHGSAAVEGHSSAAVPGRFDWPRPAASAAAPPAAPASVATAAEGRSRFNWCSSVSGARSAGRERELAAPVAALAGSGVCIPVIPRISAVLARIPSGIQRENASANCHSDLPGANVSATSAGAALELDEAAAAAAGAAAAAAAKAPLHSDSSSHGGAAWQAARAAELALCGGFGDSCSGSAAEGGASHHSAVSSVAISEVSSVGSTALPAEPLDDVSVYYAL